MTRYVTTEERITCKNCRVKFTEREIVEGMCPRCHQNPFTGLNLDDLKRAFRRTDEQFGVWNEDERDEQFDIWWNDSGFEYDIEVQGV